MIRGQRWQRYTQRDPKIKLEDGDEKIPRVVRSLPRM
jgi:hypothetical protein